MRELGAVSGVAADLRLPSWAVVLAPFGLTESAYGRMARRFMRDAEVMRRLTATAYDCGGGSSPDSGGSPAGTVDPDAPAAAALQAGASDRANDVPAEPEAPAADADSAPRVDPDGQATASCGDYVAILCALAWQRRVNPAGLTEARAEEIAGKHGVSTTAQFQGLERRCGGDPDIRRRIDSCVASGEDPGS
jgi:hypothetical protein